MGGILLILFFVILIAFPGVYIITRKVFARGDRKTALWMAGLVTLLLVVILSVVMAGAPL